MEDSQAGVFGPRPEAILGDVKGLSYRATEKSVGSHGEGSKASGHDSVC